MDTNEPVQIQLNVQWNLNPTSVPAPANNLLVVEGIGIGEGQAPVFELHFGHVSPPAIMADSPEQFAEIAASMPAVVNQVGHFTVTIDALRQMHETMSEALKKHDASRS